MTETITPNQLVSLVHRLIHLSSWLLFYVVHLILVIAIFIYLYLKGITGGDIYNLFLSLGKSMGFQTTSSILSFFGISSFGLLSAYAYLVKKIIVKYTNDYLFKNIEERNIQ